MAGPTVFPANLQWLGLGKETTYGTAAAAPTAWVPLVSPKWVPHLLELDDTAFVGNMARLQQRVPGVRYDTIDYETFPLLDSTFQHFINIYGGADTVTGAGDPWTHKTSLLNTGNGQPTSYTLWLSNGSECWRMTGCQQSSLDLETKVADSLASLNSSWMGLPATVVSAPSNTPSTAKPMPSWNTLLTIGGNASIGNYSDIKVSFKRDTEAVFGANATQSPYVIFCGEFSATWELTAVYLGYTGPTISDLQNYLTNVQPSIQVQINPAGDATHNVKWLSTVNGYDPDGVNISDSGKYIELSAKGEAIANSTDVIGSNGGLSPSQVAMLNAVSTAY